MKIFQIFKKDLKNIIKNPAAIGIIIGLCIIPSFYAWITLKANWNPYVDTGNVPVAVVNNDTGTIVNNKIVDFGTETVKELENNKTIKWTFVGQQVADQGLKDGSYYAIIEIPSDFSTDLESGITGNPIKPDLIYKVNEKTNAIATKITDLATGQLQQQIKETFLYTVTHIVLNQANALGENISTNKPMILEVKNVIANTNQNVGNILQNINNSSTNIGELGGYIGELKNNLPQVTKEINNLEGVVSSSKYLMQATQANMKNIESSLNNTNTSMSTANNSLQSTITNLKNTLNAQKQSNQDAINSANNAVNETSNVITNSTDKAKDTIQKNSDKIKAGMTEAFKDLNTVKTVNNNAKNSLDNAKNEIDNDKKLTKDAKAISSHVSNNKDINSIVNKVPHLSKEQIEKDKELLNNAISENKNLSSLINSSNQFLNTLNKLNGNNVLSGLINNLNELQKTVQSQGNELNNLNQTLSNTNEVTADMINSKLESVSELSNEINSLFGSFTNEYASTVNNSVSNISSNLNNSLNDINSVLIASKQMIPQLDVIANMGISSSDLTVNKINELKSKLDGLKINLDTLQSKTSNLTDSSLDNIVNILNKNPEQLATLLASPIGINVQELYGMSIFGIGLAPFYTVLAIWVGALLCTTIIGVNDKKEENGTRKRIMEIHFGKMLLFLAINFVQATIVTLGDVFILGIKPQNFWLLLGFAWLTGVIFTVIIFTLVSLNGNFGKAGALVLMVIQVAGSGAIYPIEVNPIFFQKLEFLWPFTYAIDGFRQAIGGPDWSQVSGDVIALLIFLAIFIVMGFSKMFISKQIDYVENAFKESEL